MTLTTNGHPLAIAPELSPVQMSSTGEFILEEHGALKSLPPESPPLSPGAAMKTSVSGDSDLDSLFFDESATPDMPKFINSSYDSDDYMPGDTSSDTGLNDEATDRLLSAPKREPSRCSPDTRYQPSDAMVKSTPGRLPNTQPSHIRDVARRQPSATKGFKQNRVLHRGPPKKTPGRPCDKDDEESESDVPLLRRRVAKPKITKTIVKKQNENNDDFGGGKEVSICQLRERCMELLSDLSILKAWMEQMGVYQGKCKKSKKCSGS